MNAITELNALIPTIVKEFEKSVLEELRYEDYGDFDFCYSDENWDINVEYTCDGEIEEEASTYDYQGYREVVGWEGNLKRIFATYKDEYELSDEELKSLIEALDKVLEV